jgi:hypothetical protein
MREPFVTLYSHLSHSQRFRLHALVSWLALKRFLQQPTGENLKGTLQTFSVLLAPQLGAGLLILAFLILAVMTGFKLAGYKWV